MNLSVAQACLTETDLERIDHSGERTAELRVQVNDLLHQIGELGAALSARRREAGKSLSDSVEAELEELRMEGARFAVDVRWQAAEDGAIVETVQEGLDGEPGRYAFDESGLDRVAFLLAANVGEDLKPRAIRHYRQKLIVCKGP